MHSWQNEADDLDLELGVGLDLEDLENVSNSPSPQHQSKTSSVLSDINGIRAGRPNLWHTALNNSQELDSGVGRTDESTRCEESSELADDATSACTTNATIPLAVCASFALLSTDGNFTTAMTRCWGQMAWEQRITGS